MHIILASTCHHPISYHFTPPPGYTTALSPSTPFCPSCTDHQTLTKLHDDAYTKFQAAYAFKKTFPEPEDIENDDVAKAKHTADRKSWALRREWRVIAVALANAEIWHDTYTSPAYPILDAAGEILIPSPSTIEAHYLPSTSKRVQFGAKPLPTGRKVRFNNNDAENWGSGTFGRRQRNLEFNRKSGCYKPGRFALPMGRGAKGRRYLDTSWGVSQVYWDRLGEDEALAVVDPPAVIDPALVETTAGEEAGATGEATEGEKKEEELDAGVEAAGEPMDGVVETSPVEEPIDWQW